jgi:hypothetical protein
MSNQFNFNAKPAVTAKGTVGYSQKNSTKEIITSQVNEGNAIWHTLVRSIVPIVFIISIYFSFTYAVDNGLFPWSNKNLKVDSNTSKILGVTESKQISVVTNLSKTTIKSYFERAQKEFKSLDRNDFKYYNNKRFSEGSIVLLGNRNCNLTPEKCEPADENYGDFDDIVINDEDIIIDRDYLTFNKSEVLKKDDYFKVQFNASLQSRTHGRSTIKGSFDLKIQQEINSSNIKNIQNNSELQTFVKILGFDFKNSCNNKTTVICE